MKQSKQTVRALDLTTLDNVTGGKTPPTITITIDSRGTVSGSITFTL
jgi:hypothetical protein